MNDSTNSAFSGHVGDNGGDRHRLSVAIDEDFGEEEPPYRSLEKKKKGKKKKGNEKPASKDDVSKVNNAGSSNVAEVTTVVPSVEHNQNGGSHTTNSYAFKRGNSTWITIDTQVRDRSVTERIARIVVDMCPKDVAPANASVIEAAQVYNLIEGHISLGSTELQRIELAHELFMRVMPVFNSAEGEIAGPLDYHGCTAIFGPSGSGKSSMIASFLPQAEKAGKFFKLIKASEPHFDSLSMSMGMSFALSSLLINVDAVVAVDSLRGIIYSGAGNTLSGGTSSLIIDTLNVLSKVAEATQNCVVAVVNPLKQDEERNSELMEAIKGSSTNIVVLSTVDYSYAEVSLRKSDRAFKKIGRESILSDLLQSGNASTQQVSMFTQSLQASPDKAVVKAEPVEIRAFNFDNVHVDIPFLSSLEEK